jgi:short-subunit dehydrogenase
MKKILILGATSAIAQSTAKRFAADKHRIFLLARNTEKLSIVASDLNVRGAESVEFFSIDINEQPTHEIAFSKALDFLGSIDILLVAHGTLPNQQSCEKNPVLLLQELQTNASSTMAFLAIAANQFEQQKKGCIAVITSVAGDRGRQSNYIYGAAKSAVSSYLSGLRNRLHKSGVNVLDIKPGFVDTPMTAEFNKSPLWAQPETIAAGIITAIEKQKSTVYLPFYWRYIMLLIRLIPEPIFKRLSL